MLANVAADSLANLTEEQIESVTKYVLSYSQVKKAKKAK